MHKTWLVSFPRSGNTFFRNVMHDVYGISSYEEWDLNFNEIEDDQMRFIKTHKLPFDLEHFDSRKDKVVYIVRDGRDSICSLSHKRKNLIEPDSDLLSNFKEATFAEKGSFYGGWANNVRLWLNEDAILVRFEELISDPIKVFTALEKPLGLSNPNWDNLPTFETQKQGKVTYGIDGGYSIVENYSKKFFRKGQVGNWKNEFPKELLEKYWEISGEISTALGYTKDGDVTVLDTEKINAIRKDSIGYLIVKYKIKYGYFQVAFYNFKQALKSNFNN